MSHWQDFTDLKFILRRIGSNASLNILHHLAGEGEITVTEVVSALGISQPLVSWHLRNLRRVGLVRTRRRGREVYCSLDHGGFDALEQALHALVHPQLTDDAPAAQAPERAGTFPVARNQDEPARQHLSRAGPGSP